MKLPDIPEVREVWAKGYAADIRGYVERRNARSGLRKATVADVCRRFRLSQTDAVYCIEHGAAGIVVSEFAYTMPPKATWGFILLHAFHPQYAPDAPIGRRLVMIIEERTA